MVQRRQQFNFGLLTAELVRIGRLRSEQLERHVPAQVYVPWPVLDGGHAAASNHFPQQVAAAHQLSLRRCQAKSSTLFLNLLPGAPRGATQG